MNEFLEDLRAKFLGECKPYITQDYADILSECIGWIDSVGQHTADDEIVQSIYICTQNGGGSTSLTCQNAL